MMYDIFISYSSKDQKVAEGVCGFMESHKLRCFVAYRDIPFSSSFAAVIPEAIKQSRVFLVIFSKDFNISPHTDREIYIAAEHNIPMLAFRIAEDKMNGTKEYFLGNLNWLDAFPTPEDYFSKLYESICQLLGKEQESSMRKADSEFQSEETLELYRAAVQGNEIAQAKLALHYIKGDGVPQNATKGAFWYEISANKGYALAQLQLGFCYYYGNGLPRSDEDALIWFKKAAYQGLPEAQHLLGIMYSSGEGVALDMDQAAFWLKMAAEQGYEKAQQKLKELSQ